MKHDTTGHIEVYAIGDGFACRVRAWRLRRFRSPLSGHHHRRTSDRWGRRWQAEHGGDFAHLGAVRGWTRTGAYLAMSKRITEATS